MKTISAYEFTKTDYTGVFTRKGVKFIDINYYISNIRHNNDLDDLRSRKEYKEADSIFFDVTSACTREECRRWLNWFMLNAVAYGWETFDKRWVFLFLAAHDMLQEL